MSRMSRILKSSDKDINPGLMSLGQRLKKLSAQISKTKSSPSSTDNGGKSTAGQYRDEEEDDDIGINLNDDDCKLNFNDIYEMARVEGYDGSYIMSSLQDIDTKLSDNDTEAALNEINEILPKVMPFDYQYFFQLFEATKETAKRLSGKVCWVLLGPTGAGKSTSIHFLCGSQFKSSGKGGNVIVNEKDIHKSLSGKDIHIGDSLIASKTRYIAEVELDLTKYGIKMGRNEPKRILCVDSPGFEDTAGPEVNMANGIGTIRALRQAEKIKVIITFKEAHLDSKFATIRNIANNMGQAVKDLCHELDKPHSSISGFLTKSEYGVEAAKETFNKAYEQTEKDSNSNDNAIFKALIYKLGEMGPLNEIKIDLENSQNNDDRIKKIIQSLVEKSGYIEAPSRAFNEFTSESTLGKLKEQIECDLKTIRNILNHEQLFENPSYIQYIIDILGNIDKLKGIIKSAGGTYVKSKFKECLETLKTKWNHKILKAQQILTKMDLKECSKHSMNKRLTEFAKIEKMMEANMEVIKTSKYHKELKDTNCLNEEFHACFDELYGKISIYLNEMVNKLKSDDDMVSDTDVEKDDEKYPQQQFDDDDGDDDEEGVDNIYRNDDDYDRKILAYIQKCSLLKQQKNDKYIKTKWRKLDTQINDIIKALKAKCKDHSSKKAALNVNAVPLFIQIYSGLCKLQKIVATKKGNLNDLIPMTLDKETSDYHPGGEEYDDEAKGDDESSPVFMIIKESIDKFKDDVNETIEAICGSYSLYVMPSTSDSNNNGNKYVDIDDILQSKAIKTVDQIRKRETRLISFCKWIDVFNHALSDTNLSVTLNGFSEWLRNIQNNFIKWLSNACNEELEACNKLLIDKQAEGWKSVEKILSECKSLRKVEEISNKTSRQYFKTVNELESSKRDLALKAEKLIEELDGDSKDINYDEVLRIADQLYSAGCSNESTEMKQIYQKLKFHLKDLKLKTDQISLSIEAADDLIIVQDTMNELNTIQRFARFMPDIKEDANECYKTLNDQVLDILREIYKRYDLEKCSTQSSRDLQQKLAQYLDVKSEIDEKILNEVIIQCSSPSLTQLINQNEKRINQLLERNESIQQMIQQKGGAIIDEKEKCEKTYKNAKDIQREEDRDEMMDYIKSKGFKSLRQIRAKIEELTKQSESICVEEQEEARNNKAEIKRLHEINPEIEKCVEIENDLKSLNVPTNTIIEYRRNNHSLKNKVNKLEDLLKGNQTYIFPQISLNDTYRALQFLSKCQGIRWTLKNTKSEEKEEENIASVVSSKYISEINQNASKYLRAYGKYLETNLNNLFTELAITDIDKCDLNDKKYVNFVSNAISKLNDCLREFRDISSFDHQIKLQIEEDMIYNEDSNKPRQKQLKLASALFANFNIQSNVDQYINDIISKHKSNILTNFAQWKDGRPEALPILRFVCLSMSTLEEYVSSSSTQTYHKILSEIDTKLSKSGDDHTQKLLPLFKSKNWTELTRILQSLQKTADAHKTGSGQKVYRDAVMQLRSLLIKLINDTKNKLLIDFDKNNDMQGARIMALNDALKDVTSLVETILPHLGDKQEKKKVKKEAEELFASLSNQLRQLMKAALQAVKRRDFKMCERRLDNISKLIQFDIQTLIPMDDGDDEKGGGGAAKNNINIRNEYNDLNDKIKSELDVIRKQVKKANKSLGDTNVFNPYSRLRLIKLHSALSKSQNEQFIALWDDIEQDILAEIQNILNKIQERCNQIQMQNEYETVNRGNDDDDKMMTYQQQNQYLRKIKLSLSSFPAEMKETVQTLLTETTGFTKGNVQYITDGYDRNLESNAFDAVARNLNGFKQSNPKLYTKSQQSMITKMNGIYDKFKENMKSNQGFLENLNELDLYKTIGLTFTKIKYDDDDDDSKDNTKSNKSHIRIDHVQNTLTQIYKEIKKYFFNQYEVVKHSLVGYKKYTLLKSGFFTVIQVVQRKNKFPIHIAQYIMNESRKLLNPLEKLINKLKMQKNQGLDREKCDIGILLQVLDDLKALTENDLQSDMRKFLPMIDKKVAKEMDKTIEEIDYNDTVQQTKEMLTECKESVSKQGLNEKMLKQPRAKRSKFLKKTAMQITALTKAGSDSICFKHLDIKPTEFKKKFIEPCTKKMKNDVRKMEKQTIEAFKKKTLNTKELDGVNANFEALYALKNEFGDEMEDNELLEEIKVETVIESCTDTAIKKVNHLAEQIQNGDKKNMDDYMDQCSQSLMNLQYLNQHINFKTSINETKSDDVVVDNEKNEVSEHIQEAIKRSMNAIQNDEEMKPKVMALYNRIIEVDANYGSTFTQQQPLFKSSLAKARNKQFHELNEDDLIENLKKSGKRIKKSHKKLIGIDYDEIRTQFQYIKQKYNKLVDKNLQSAKSFEELKSSNIPTLATDLKSIAEKAVRSKEGWYQKMRDSGMELVKAGFTWLTGSKSKNNPRKCYWTNEMIKAASDIIAYILAIWTLSNASCYYESKDGETLMKPRNAQIVAICALLCLDIDSKNEIINNLVEVGTGEGKSVIMAVTAMTLAMLDFDVYCACYSELLSKRDEEAFNDLFKILGVQKHIHYQTFNNIFEQVINDGGDIRETTKNIVLAKEIGDSEDSKIDEKEEQQRLLQKRQKILFIDEVDKFFSTDFFGKQYTPSCVIPKGEMKHLILFVWNKYLSNNSDGITITMQVIEASEEYKALLTAFNSEWHDLLKESMKDIIDAIRTFKDDSYKIMNGKDIAYKFSDTYSTKVFYGYRTLFTYLYELNRGNINDEPYVHAKLTWFLKCGSFSYSEIPKDFYAIMGVTGTLNSLSAKEHEVMQKSYGVKKYVIMPSLFDKSGKLYYAKNRDIYVLKREHFYNQLHSTIQSYQINDIESIQRPIIVFFKDENQLNYFYNLECCESWRMDDVIQKLTPDLTEQEKQNGILNATKPNTITFATEEYGRGIDFKVFDKKLKGKGLHVECTFWPHTLAEETQIKGRTARQGQKGSFHIILNEDEIMDQCEVSSEEIKKHQDNGNLYDWLSELRSKVFAKLYDEAFDYVEELKPIHKQSEQLAAALRSKNVKIAKEKLLLFNKGANIQSAAKLSILIDCTGSMSSCLTQCKIVIQRTIPKLVEFLNSNGINSDSFEIQVIGYRNYDCKAPGILESCSFTSDKDELTEFIHSLRARCGWGAEEAVEVGFKQLNRQEKKPNIVLLMADAPSHTKADMIRKKKSHGDSYWKEAEGGLFTDLDWKEELNKFMSENGESKVFCFYLINYAKANFDQIAKIGNGKSIYLNVSNQEQSVSTLQGALTETILLAMNNGNMEYVNQFRAQHKDIPTFL